MPSTRPSHAPWSLLRRVHEDERGQSLAIVLSLIAFLFLVGSAMAAHTSVALRATVAGDGQADEFHAADAGAELGIWWQRNGRPGNPPPISVNGTTVTTNVAISGSGTSCGAGTPVALTGFEHGGATDAGGGLFSLVSGNGVAADGSVARSGGWSLRIANTNGSSHNASLAATGAALVARVYLRLDTLPSVDVSELLTLVAAAGDNLRLGYRAADQRLTLGFGATPPTAAATAVGAATWYRLDLRLVAGSDPRTADWQLDGVAQPSIAATGPASSTTALRFGSTVGADNFTVNYDDVLASTTPGDYPIGPGAILALRPDGTGTHNVPGSFRHEDGSAIDASTAQRVDDDPMTSAVDYVRQQVVGATSYIEVTFGDTTAACIVGVSGVVAFHSASSAGNTGKTSVFDGSTERILYSGDMARPSLLYGSAVLPRAGGWTTGAVNALRARFGYSTDVSPNPYWDALLLEVATGAGGATATVTVTASAGASTVVTTYEDAGAAPPTLQTWSATR